MSDLVCLFCGGEVEDVAFDRAYESDESYGVRRSGNGRVRSGRSRLCGRRGAHMVSSLQGQGALPLRMRDWVVRPASSSGIGSGERSDIGRRGGPDGTGESRWCSTSRRRCSRGGSLTQVKPN